MKLLLQPVFLCLLLLAVSPSLGKADESPRILKLSQPGLAGGKPLVIFGEGFGRHRGKVLLADKRLLVSRWSSSRIEAVVPRDLAVAEYPLVIGKGKLHSEPVPFQLLPQIDHLEADASQHPIVLTLTGSKFGEAGEVRIGGAKAEILDWKPGVVTVRVPTDIAPAWHDVYLEVNGTSAFAGQFGLPPLVSSFSVTEGTFGTRFRFTGDNFGDAAPHRYVVFGDWSKLVSAPVEHWSAHEVTAKIPAGVPAGDQQAWLFIDNVPSKRYDVLIVPTIQKVGIEISSGVVSLGITGANFGDRQLAGQVSLGGVSVPVTDWSYDRIVVQMGSVLTVGTREIVVTANGIATRPALLHIVDTPKDLQDGVWRRKYEPPEVEEGW